MDFFISDNELTEIINDGIEEAEIELKGENGILNIICDISNGNTDGTSDYSDRIINDTLSDEDKNREKKLKELTKDF